MLDWVTEDQVRSPLLSRCAGIALVIEMILVTATGWQEHWLAHPSNAQDESQFIEAEVFEVPAESHLMDEKQSAPSRARPEISLRPQTGKTTSASAMPAADEENQTDAGPKIAPTHGPIAVYAPPPVLPAYLQNREFRTNVVIDFYVHAQGSVTPRLVGSSGEEELDAIALEAVKKWQFRPAEKDHKAIDAKVRLRIVFEVH